MALGLGKGKGYYNISRQFDMKNGFLVQNKKIHHRRKKTA